MLLDLLDAHLLRAGSLVLHRSFAVCELWYRALVHLAMHVGKWHF